MHCIVNCIQFRLSGNLIDCIEVRIDVLETIIEEQDQQILHMQDFIAQIEEQQQVTMDAIIEEFDASIVALD